MSNPLPPARIKIGRTYYLDIEESKEFNRLCTTIQRSTSWVVNALMSHYNAHPEDLQSILDEYITTSNAEE